MSQCAESCVAVALCGFYTIGMTGVSVIKVLAFGGGIYLLINLYALLVSDRLIFAPQAPGYTQLPGEVKIMSGHGERINAVYLEHPAAKRTILFSHGNAEDLSNVVPFMRQFHDLGYSVLMYDYRGYGTSEGSPSSRNAKQDVAAAYDWLVQEKGIAPQSIISQGRSLGGALAIWLAAHREVGGLIAEISFASAFRVKTRWPLLPWDKFDSLKSIRRAECPVLVIHGTADEIIPFWHGQKLYEAATKQKEHLWIEGGTHYDYVYVAGEEYIGAIQRFISRLSN
jgi:fermentation-respiration switch protein FrsA (DUF1100 family)